MNSNIEPRILRDSSLFFRCTAAGRQSDVSHTDTVFCFSTLSVM